MNIFKPNSIVKHLYFDNNRNQVIQSLCRIKPFLKSHEKSKNLKRMNLKNLFGELPSVLQGITSEYLFDVCLIQQSTIQIQKNAIYLQAIIQNLGLLNVLEKRPMFNFICIDPKDFFFIDEESSIDIDENERALNQERFYTISNFFNQKVQKLKKAIESDEKEMVDLLLNFGIIPDLSCLEAAIFKDNLQLFNLFINYYRLVPNQKSLAVALQTDSNNNKNELINTIIDLGVKPDLYCLNLVIAQNWVEMIDRFLKFNIQPTQESMNLAIQTGNIRLVQKLLDLKMEPNEKCLEAAIEAFTNDESIIDLFLSLGVIPSSSSILALIKYNHVKNRAKLINKLSERGAKPDETCLIEAIQRKDLQMIEFILSYVKPDTNCLNATIRKNSIPLFEKFIKLGAIPDLNSLRYAVEYADQYLIDYLLNYGIRPTISIISLAIDKDNKNQDLVKKLMQKRDEVISHKN